MFTYSQSTGVLTGPGVVKAQGYAGHGDGLNNPAAQNIHNVGPVPQGKYTIGPLLKIGPARTGVNVMALTPDPANQMFGRSGFYVHGDNDGYNHTASDGCIVLGPQTRLAIAASGDHELTVTA